VTGFGNRFAVSMRFGAAALVAFTTALTIGAASSFQDQMVKIDNLTNLTTSDTEKLSKKILELSETLPKSPAEIGATFYQVLNSGIRDVALAEQIAVKSIKAATIAQTDSSEVAKTLTAVLKAYGVENISVADATDIMVAATKAGRVEFSDFSRQMGRVLGIAPTLGIEFDELAAALAALTNVLPAEQAGTALLGILNQISSGGTAEAKQIFKDLGTSVEEFRSNIADKGLLPSLQEFLALSNNNIQVLDRLLPEVRGYNGALILLGESYEQNVAILAEVRRSGGITEEAFKRASETFSSQAKLLRNQLNIALIQLGAEILPIVTKNIRILIGWFAKNRDSIVEWAKTITNVVVTAVAGFVKGVGLIVDGFQAIVGKKGAVIAAFVAIGLAIVVALGPASAAYLALAGIITLMGIVASKGQGVADSISGFFGLPDSKASSPAIEGVFKRLQKTGQNDPRFIEGELRKAGVPGFAAPEIAESLADKINKENAARKEATKATEDSEIALKAAESAFTDVDISGGDAADAANKAAEALQALAQEFQTSSEAAGKVTDLTEELNLFGIVTKELADTMGFSATVAGQVQGYDAYVRAAERAERESFNLARALGTIAEAARNSIAVAQEIVLGVARTALDLTRSAAGAVFGQPTQEVAALELQVAQREPGRILLEQQINPLVEALQEQLDRINDLERDRVEAIDDQIKNLKDVEDKRLKLLKERLDIEKEQLSELNRSLQSFLDSIEETIGRLQAARPFARNDDERGEIDDVLEGFEENRREILDAMEAQEDNVTSIEHEIDAREEAIDRQVEALEKQKEAIQRATEVQERSIQSQIEILQKQVDAYNRDTEAIETQIDLYTAYSDILQKQIQLADSTLLTESEQIAKGRELIELTAQTSAVVRDLSQKLGVDLIPELDAAREATRLLKDMMNVLADPTIIANLIPSLDVAALRAQILAKAEEDLSASASGASGAVGGLGQSASNAGTKIEESAVRMRNGLDIIHENINNLFNRPIIPGAGMSVGPANPFDQFTNRLDGNADGGWIMNPTISKLAERGPEVVLPVTNAARSRELLRSLPYGLLSGMMGGGGSGGGVTVQVNGDVNISDPRRDTGPIGDMGWAAARAMGSRGVSW
jgi:TP901 family phage tail tape measure protein